MAYAAYRFGELCLAAMAGRPVKLCAYVESALLPDVAYFASPLVLGPNGIAGVLQQQPMYTEFHNSTQSFCHWARSAPSRRVPWRPSSRSSRPPLPRGLRLWPSSYVTGTMGVHSASSSMPIHTAHAAA